MRICSLDFFGLLGNEKVRRVNLWGRGVGRGGQRGGGRRRVVRACFWAAEGSRIGRESKC